MVVKQHEEMSSLTVSLSKEDLSEIKHTISEQELLEFMTSQMDKLNTRLQNLNQKIDDAFERMEKMESQGG